MKIHFDEQTVDVDAGLVALHFNVVHEEHIEAPVETTVETPAVETTETPVETTEPIEPVTA